MPTPKHFARHAKKGIKKSVMAAGIIPKRRKLGARTASPGLKKRGR